MLFGVLELEGVAMVRSKKTGRYKKEQRKKELKAEKRIESLATV
jgi:hypothetical protein